VPPVRGAKVALTVDGASACARAPPASLRALPLPPQRSQMIRSLYNARRPRRPHKSAPRLTLTSVSLPAIRASRPPRSRNGSPCEAKARRPLDAGRNAAPTPGAPGQIRVDGSGETQTQTFGTIMTGTRRRRVRLRRPRRSGPRHRTRPVGAPHILRAVASDVHAWPLRLGLAKLGPRRVGPVPRCTTGRRIPPLDGRAAAARLRRARVASPRAEAAVSRSAQVAASALRAPRR
jgi:hypothetical protein